MGPGSQECVIAVIDADDAIVGHLSPQFVEEARRVDDIGRIMPVPVLAIGGLVVPDLLAQAPLCRAARPLRFQLFLQLPENGACIAGYRDLGREVGIEDIRIDVDVNQIVRHLGAVTAGRDLREARADRDHAVASLERILRRRHRGGAEAKADMQRMIGGEHGQSLQGGGDRRLQPFGKPDQLVARVTRAPAGEDTGMFGGCQHLGCARNLESRLRHAAPEPA